MTTAVARARRARERRSRTAAARARAARHSPRRRRSAPQRRGARAVAAEHSLLVGQLVPREHEETALAEELVVASRHDTGPALAAVVGFVLVFLFVLEAHFRGALAQDHVERFLDVIRVEFLVEVDDVVV